MRSVGWIAIAALAFVAPADGQDELVGTWQLIEAEPEEFTITFASDGSFAAVLPSSLVFDEPEEAEEPDEHFSLAEIAEGAEFHLAGEWEVDGDEITFLATGAEFIWDGGDFGEFWVEAGKALAASTAESEGIDEANYEQFEQETIDALLLLYPPEEFLNVLVGVFDESTMSYSLEGDVLTLVDEDGPEEWRRVDASSAVPELSWGELKGRL